MSAEIKVDSVALVDAIGRYKQSLTTFQPFVDNFVHKSLPLFDGMDSQFANKLKMSVNNLADDIKKDLFLELENFGKDVQQTADIFTATDKELDGMIGEPSND